MSSDRYPVQANAIKKGDYIIIDQRPCKVMDSIHSKPGKHGHAKFHFVALDIFDNSKHEMITSASHNVDVPYVSNQDYQLLNITDDEYLSLRNTKDFSVKEDLKLPLDKDLSNKIKEYFENSEDVLLVVTKACDKEQVMSIKQMK